MIKIIIAIPVLNEERFIINCLKSIKDFTVPENVDIATKVLDGGSSDNTLKLVTDFISKNKNFSLIHNKKKIQPAAMNIIINRFNYDYLMRLDAHCIYPKNYLSLCLETALRTNAENVGGVLETLPGGMNLGAQIVQNLSSSWFGVGNAGFRIGMEEGKTDTVPFGFFSNKAIKVNGFFDEELVRAQDYEYNRRILSNGGIIWINPKIIIKYFNQKYFFNFIKKLLFKDGPYNAYMWYKYDYTFSLRHTIPALFFLGNLAGLLLLNYHDLFLYVYLGVLTLYFLLACVASIQLYLNSRKFFSSLIMPIAFFMMHFFYGAGEFLGCIRVLTKTAPISK